MMTQGRQLGEAFPVINSPSVLGNIKHFLTRVFVDILGTQSERGEKTKQNKNKTNKPEPKIAQHCMGRMIKLWHSGDRCGGFILSL